MANAAAVIDNDEWQGNTLQMIEYCAVLCDVVLMHTYVVNDTTCSLV